MLKRELKRWDLVLFFFNCIIGAGIFGLPSQIFNLSGTYSILAILICALLVGIIVLNFAEVGSQFNRSGGSYLYALKVFGKYPGYINGWLAFIARVTAYAALINLMVDYLGYLSEIFDRWWFRSITITVITVFLFYVNFKGVKSSSWFNNFIAIAKLVPLLIFISVGMFFIDPELLKMNSSLPSEAKFLQHF